MTEPPIVKDLAGREIKVLTTEDLAGMQRSLMRWLIGSIVVSITVAFALGVWIATLQAQVRNSAEHLTVLENTGSRQVPLLAKDIALLQQHIETLDRQLDRLEAQLEQLTGRRCP
jgi:ubiquinone biosynthesis protein UbiJ